MSAPPAATAEAAASATASLLTSPCSAAEEVGPVGTGRKEKALKGVSTPAWVALRHIELGPKSEQDNYEISEPAGSDEEHDRDRSHKHQPTWCENYLLLLARQDSVDPDSIFTSRVPQCHLDEIFTEEQYKQVGKRRPKRERGSSGNWQKDRLTRHEVAHYKSRMGHAREWDVMLDADASALAGGLA